MKHQYFHFLSLIVKVRNVIVPNFRNELFTRSKRFWAELNSNVLSELGLYVCEQNTSKSSKKVETGNSFFFFWNLLETARKIILGVFWGIWYSVKYFKSKQETQTRILSPSLHVFGELYYAGYLCSCNLELHHLVSCATHRIFPWVSPFSCGRMRLIVF